MNLLAMVPLPYRLFGLALLAIALFGFGWIKGAEHGEAKLSAFQAAVRAEGVKAQAVADARAAADRQRKESSDASYSKALALLSADANRLRLDAGRGVLPAATTDPRCPQGWACFDRAELDAALRGFTAETAGIATEGGAVVLRLETAIRWANP